MKLQALATMLKNMIDNQPDIADMEVFVEDADEVKRMLILGIKEYGFNKNYRFIKRGEIGHETNAICIGFLPKQKCSSCGRY